MSPRVRTLHAILARIAHGQHGVVSRAQLLAAGITPNEIRGRLRAGVLIPVFRGVYRVGHRAPSFRATAMAAVLACGEGAFLSGLAAAFLHGLLREPPRVIEVTALGERRVEGIVCRRSRSHDPADVMRVDGIRVARVPRTLVDLAATLDDEALGRACHEAGVRHRITPRHVEAVLARRPSSAGAGALRRIMSGDQRVTLSALERRFLELLEQAALPLPVTNRRAGGRRVDCRWPEHRLTVELDSYRFHQTRRAWELDRRREREAHARGDEFRRYTWGDVFEDPRLMLAELRRLLPSHPG